MTSFRVLYVTTPNIEEARSIGRQLVEQRLVACANILPQIESIFRWNDSIQTESECVLIMKTHIDRIEEATRAIVELHSYDVPCVVSLPIESGSEPYLKWLNIETRPS